MIRNIFFIGFLVLFSNLLIGCKSSESGTMEVKYDAANVKSIVLGGGCFWCVEAQYELLKGVVAVESGYAGGTTANPTYKEVSAGATDHTEVIKVSFDSTVVTLEELIDAFWLAHDPTTLNRQGNDVGAQYRSAIYYTDDSELPIIEASIAKQQTKLTAPIVTEVKPLAQFYIAEGYHQDYFAINPNQSYCQYVVRPKVEKFKHKVALPLKK
jgi:peptide-methionine (S)-S-oxide reductase